ncbi:MAG: PQQ-dependent dehydrogenase, methanol/ethanol family [Pseudohongiellaceae bacterium]
MLKNLTALSGLLALLLAGCDDGEAPAPAGEPTATAATTSFANVTRDRLLNAAAEPDQWMTYGGSYNEQRFSALSQITPDNISQLGLAWFADFSTNRGQESTPLMIDGVLYVSQSWSKVNAYDARTGALLWEYDPKVAGEFGARGCCDVVNRGVAAWNGKIYVGVYDGRLVALDAATGREVWSTVTTDQSKFYTITGAPRVANGKVFIGNAGAEYLYRGYVSAYDAESGALVWRFYTVPGNPAAGFESPAMEMAAKTWSGNWWEKGGGGSTWDAITYDPRTNLVLFGVGNGAPWNAKARSPQGGDNLFTVSVVAVDADTGEYRWHFQEIPEEEWDFDAVQQITLADIEIDGATRHVAMQATKSGYYYMMDATTGQLLVADNFVPVNWTTGYDLATGRPVINDGARYTRAEGPRIAQPGPVGAHSWHPMAYSPLTGLLYIPARESSIAYTVNPNGSPGNFNLNVNFTGGDAAYDEPGNTIPRGGSTKVLAWDPVLAREVWSSERPTGASVGMQVTAGNVLFTGNPVTQELLAFRADNGEQIWSYRIQAGISAGSISYALDGEQYLAQVVGGQSPGGYYAPTYARLLVFKLGGTATLPPNAEFTQAPFAPPEQFATPELVAAGATLYGGACAICHGDGGASRGMFPDLRRSPLLHSQQAFDQVVLGGIRQDRGMASFEGKLTPAETDSIRAYMVDRAIVARDTPPLAPPGQ